LQFKSSRITPQTRIVHKVMPGRPLVLAFLGRHLTFKQLEDRRAKRRIRVQVLDKPRKIFGMSSRDLRSRLILGDVNFTDGHLFVLDYAHRHFLSSKQDHF